MALQSLLNDVECAAATGDRDIAEVSCEREMQLSVIRISCCAMLKKIELNS